MQKRPFNDPRLSNLPQTIGQAPLGNAVVPDLVLWERSLKNALKTQADLDNWLKVGEQISLHSNGHVDLTNALRYYLTTNPTPELRALTFSNCSIGNLNDIKAPYMRDVIFERCEFENLSMNTLVLDDVTFTKCQGDVELTDARMSNVIIQNSDFKSFILEKAVARGVIIRDTKFVDMITNDCSLNAMQIERCQIATHLAKGGTLSSIEFTESTYGKFEAIGQRWINVSRSECITDFTTLLNISFEGDTCVFESETCSATTSWINVKAGENTDVEVVDSSIYRFELTDSDLDYVTWKRCTGDSFNILRGKQQHLAWDECTWDSYFHSTDCEMHDTWLEKCKTKTIKFAHVEQYQTQLCGLVCERLLFVGGSNVDPFWHDESTTEEIIFEKAKLVGGQYQEINTDKLSFLECVVTRNIAIVDRCKIRELEVRGGDWSECQLRVNESLQETSKLTLSQGGWLANMPWIGFDEINEKAVAIRDWQIKDLSKSRLKTIEAQMFNARKHNTRSSYASIDTSGFGGNSYDPYNTMSMSNSGPRFYKLSSVSSKADKATAQFASLLSIDTVSVKDPKPLKELMKTNGIDLS